MTSLQDSKAGLTACVITMLWIELSMVLHIVKAAKLYMTNHCTSKI